jgi:hypothetical protein
LAHVTAATEGPTNKRADHIRRWMSSMEAAALAGAVAAALMSVSIHLLRRQPGLNSSDAELIAWFGNEGNRRAVVIGLKLSPFAGIAFLWFMAVIRRRVGSREDQFFSTVFIGSGIAFVTLMVAAAAAAAAPTLVIEYGHRRSVDGDIVALGQGLWFGLFVISASRFAAVFMIMTSTLGIRFRAFPRWLSLLGYVAALILFATGAFSGPLAFLFPGWLIVVSLTLLVTRMKHEGLASRES